MSDYISKEKLMSHIESQYKSFDEDYDALQILGDIEDFPTEQRPHGEWEFIGDNLFKCTNCGYVADADYLRKWKVHTYDAEFPTACLNCGADMREGDSDA